MKFLIFLVIFFFFFRLVFPYILRWAIKAFVKKTIQKGTFQNGTFQTGTFQGSAFGNGTFQNGTFQNNTNGSGPASQTHTEPEGEIKVDYVPKNTSANKPADFQGGEYVDYEEVK